MAIFADKRDGGLWRTVLILLFGPPGWELKLARSFDIPYTWKVCNSRLIVRKLSNKTNSLSTP